ncbi:hypothetical protein [Humibacter sp.]|uniref:hypothetical protein n=1 Tax=Humibacter sp. TaxID=1940291 RepID=UPI003F805766
MNHNPAQPTVSAGTPTSSGVTLTGSAFSDFDGDTHAASQWQVTTSADTGYASPVISTGDDASNLTSYAATGLTASTAYIARVRYKDSAGNYSAWSANASFTTAAGGFAAITDSFTRTNASSLGNADTGQAWAVSSGTWSTNGSQATSASTVSVAFIDSATANRTISVKLADLTNAHGLAFMYANSSNYYRYYYSSGTLFLQSVIAGSGAAVISPAQTLSPGDVLKVIISGGTFTCQVNDVTIAGGGNLTPNAALAANTKDGMYMGGLAGGLFDNYTVTTP